MSQPASSTYPSWKAPSEDGEVLIWPEPGQLLKDARENQSRLSRASGRIQNIPMSEIRSAMRRFLGHDDERPLLASGHQAELYHAGVWAKDVLIARAARALDGAAYHVAVDTDSPKHLQVRWPHFAAPITDDAGVTSAAWCARLAPPTPAHLSEIEHAARRDFARLGFQPPLFDFLAALRRLSLESIDLPTALTNAQHEIDWQLGLRHHALLVSPAMKAPSYLAFVHHLLARAEDFAARYNAALDQYRTRQGIRSSMRPMPDLFVHAQSIEAPFWLDDLAGGTRSRPSVFRSDGGWMLELLDGSQFVFDPDADAFDAAAALDRFLTRTDHRLSPRALTLTIFLRLLVADQFVHGIGGARYDQVADEIMASYFDIVPPKFCVTTATLFFPGWMDQPRACLPCLQHDGHHLEHGVLGERKRAFIEEIEALPRKSPQREAVFIAMHRQRRAAVESSPEIERWKRASEEAEVRRQEEQTLLDRELFYAVQSHQRLQMLVDRYAALVGG